MFCFRKRRTIYARTWGSISGGGKKTLLQGTQIGSGGGGGAGSWSMLPALIPCAATPRISLSRIANSINQVGHVPVFISSRTGWVSYIPRQWAPFSSPQTTIRVTAEVSNQPPRGLTQLKSKSKISHNRRPVFPGIRSPPGTGAKIFYLFLGNYLHICGFLNMGRLL
jgi:hypothetical protein